MEFELIDTLWNVNKEEKPILEKPTQGINRYIMECKFNDSPVLRGFCWELIDTLWNVNRAIPSTFLSLSMN